MVKIFTLLIILILSFDQAQSTQYGGVSQSYQNPAAQNYGYYDGDDYGNDAMDNLQPSTNSYSTATPSYPIPTTNSANNTYDGYQAPQQQPLMTLSTPAAANPISKQQQKLKGLEYINHLQNALLEGNKESVCGKGGVCRKNFGEGCKTSKNFLSVCATICSDNNEFRGSYCINNGAKRYRMNAQTFIYNARPEKQKPAESVVQHVAVQLSEGRKALRDDKRLFFNTFCTQPAIQMVPGSDRPVVARACLDFLYNGNPPASAIQKLENENILQSPAMEYAIAQPGEQFGGQSPDDQPAVEPDADQSGPDDVQDQTPMGGLTEDPGPDKGAVYTGPGTPIIEDKESPAPSVKKAKGKKEKMGRTKVPASDQQPAIDSSNMIDNGDDQPQTDNTPQQDPLAGNDQQQDQNAQSESTADQQQAQQDQEAPGKKEKGLLDQLGGKDGIKGLLKKFTKKGGNGSEDPDGDEQGGDDAEGTDKLGDIGKFLKF